MKIIKKQTSTCSQKKLSRTIHHCALLVAMGAVSVSASAQDASKIFAWLARGTSDQQIPEGTDISPIPFVGKEYATPGLELNPIFKTLYDNQHDKGTFIGVMLMRVSAPVNGSSEALKQVVDYLHDRDYKLDYVFSDLEDEDGYNTSVQDVEAIVAQVRNNPDPNINSARIGQYHYYPGAIDLSGYDQNHIDNSEYDALYRKAGPNNSVGLNVAMPNCYPYGIFKKHAEPGAWPAGQLSPNARSGLFYAPLEKFSTAKRALPAGHELIPWITDYQDMKNNNPTSDQLPTPGDNAALLQHFRLRGADGYYTLSVNKSPLTGVDTYYWLHFAVGDNLQQQELAAAKAYYKDMNVAWHELDAFFALPGDAHILNLSTNKTSGVEWSAVRKGDRVHVLVSNLSTAAQSVDWSFYPQMPLLSPVLAAGTHKAFETRSFYLENDDMASYTLGEDMSNQGALNWSGISPINFVSTLVDISTGNASGAVVQSVANADAWYTTHNPGFAATDKVVYSAWLFRHSDAITFLPINTTGVSASALPAASAQGPALSIDGSQFKLRKSRDAGTVYTAVNLGADADKWYEVQIAVDPGNGGSGDFGTAAVWVRNVSDHQTEFTRLVFDDPATPTVVERLKTIALQLNTTAGRSTTDFNGWQISAAGDGNAIDNLNAGYYLSHGENFEHYDAMAASMSADPDWLSNASSWRVRAPYNSSGNGSAQALTPAAGSYNVSGAWYTENPRFSPTDVVAYQAKLYSGNAATARPVGFAPYHNSTANTGPYVQLYWTDLRLRSIVPNGAVYRANNITVQPNCWYEVRVVVDPNHYNSGVPGESHGGAKLFVRNITNGETELQPVTLDNIDTSTVETETEIPLQLNSLRDTTVLDGWYAYGYDESSQIDDLKAFVLD